MKNYLQNIHLKSEQERKRIRIIATVSIWSLIVIVWATMTYVQYSSSSPAVAKSVEKHTPVETFKKGFSDLYASVGDAWQNLKKNLMPEGRELWK